MSSNWSNTWNFTFGQLMKKYLMKNGIELSDKSFDKRQTSKDTREEIYRNTYRKTVEAWVKKNDSLRNVADRKKLKERFKMFLKSLKGFTDWDTAGGTIKDWENYQLKRWEAYKDLTKQDKDLPESLTTRKEIRDAEKK